MKNTLQVTHRSASVGGVRKGELLRFVPDCRVSQSIDNGSVNPMDLPDLHGISGRIVGLLLQFGKTHIFDGTCVVTVSSTDELSIAGSVVTPVKEFPEKMRIFLMNVERNMRMIKCSIRGSFRLSITTQFSYRCERSAKPATAEGASVH